MSNGQTPYDPYENPSEWIGKVVGKPPSRDPIRRMFPSYEEFEEFLNRSRKKWETPEDMENYINTVLLGVNWNKVKKEKPTLEEIGIEKERRKGIIERGMMETGMGEPGRRQIHQVLRPMLKTALAPATLTLEGLSKLGVPKAGEIAESTKKALTLPPEYEPKTPIEQVLPAAGSLAGLIWGGPGQIGGAVGGTVGKALLPMLRTGLATQIGPKAAQVASKALAGWAGEAVGLGTTLATAADDTGEIPEKFISGAKLGTAFFLGKFVNLARMPKTAAVFRQMFTRTVASVMDEYDAGTVQKIVQGKFDAISPQEWYNELLFTWFSRKKMSPKEFFADLDALKKEAEDLPIEVWEAFEMDYGGRTPGNFIHIPGRGMVPMQGFTGMEHATEAMMEEFDAANRYNELYPESFEGGAGRRAGAPEIPVTKQPARFAPEIGLRMHRFKMAMEESAKNRKAEVEQRLAEIPIEIELYKKFRGQQPVEDLIARLENEAMNLQERLKQGNFEGLPPKITSELDIAAAKRMGIPIPSETLKYAEKRSQELTEAKKEPVTKEKPTPEKEMTEAEDIALANTMRRNAMKTLLGIEEGSALDKMIGGKPPETKPEKGKPKEESYLDKRATMTEVIKYFEDEFNLGSEKAYEEAKSGIGNYKMDHEGKFPKTVRDFMEWNKAKTEETEPPPKMEAPVEPQKPQPTVEEVSTNILQKIFGEETEPTRMPRRTVTQRLVETGKEGAKKKAREKSGEKVSPELDKILEGFEDKEISKIAKQDTIKLKDILERDDIPDEDWLRVLGHKNKVKPLTPAEISLFRAKGGRVTVLRPKKMSLKELIENGLVWEEYAKPQAELVAETGGWIKQAFRGKKGAYRPFRQPRTDFERVLHDLAQGKDVADLSTGDLDTLRKKGFEIQIQKLRGKYRLPEKKAAPVTTARLKPETKAEKKAFEKKVEKEPEERKAAWKKTQDVYKTRIKEAKDYLEYLRSEKKKPERGIRFFKKGETFEIRSVGDEWVETKLLSSPKKGETGKIVNFRIRDVEKELESRSFEKDITDVENRIKDLKTKKAAHLKRNPEDIQHVYSGLDFRQGLKEIGEYIYDRYSDPSDLPKEETVEFVKQIADTSSDEQRFKVGYRVVNNFRRMGKGGRMLADMADDYIMKRAQKEQDALYRFMQGHAMVVAGSGKKYRGLLNRRKLNIEVGKRIYDLLEGKIEPRNIQEEEGTNIIRKLLDEVADRAIELDIDIRGATGKRKFQKVENYAPRMYRDLRKFFEAKEFTHLRDMYIKKVANSLFKGQPDAMEKARIYFEEMYDNLKSRPYGHLERERLLTDGELEHLEKEWKKQNPGKKFPLERVRTSESLIKYLVQAHDRLEWIGQFGQDIQERKGVYLPKNMAKAVAEMKNPDNITYVKNSMKRYLMQGAAISPRLHRWLRAYRTANMAKLAFAFIPNSMQWFTNTIPKIDFRSALETGWDLAGYYGLRGKQVKQELNDYINKTGVATFRNAFNAAMMEDPRTVNKAGEFILKSHLFAQTENFNAIFSGFAGRRYAQRLMGKLYKGRGKSYRSQFYVDELNKLGFKQSDIDWVIANGPMKDKYFQQVADASFRMRQATQFLADAFHLPASWSSPGGRVITQFKNFAYNQTALIWDITKEGAKFFATGGKQGDITKTFKMIPALMLAGNLIHKLKKWGYPKIGIHYYEELLAGRSWPVKQLSLLSQTGGFGIAFDIYGAFVFGKSGFTNLVGGPAISDLANLWDALSKTYQELETSFSNSYPKWLSLRAKRIRDYWLQFGERLAPDVKLLVQNFVSDYKSTKEIGNWSHVVTDAYRKYKELYMMKNRDAADKFWEAFMKTQGQEYYDLIGKWPQKPTYKQILKWWTEQQEHSSIGMKKRAPGKAGAKKTPSEMWKYDYWK